MCVAVFRLHPREKPFHAFDSMCVSVNTPEGEMKASATLEMRVDPQLAEAPEYSAPAKDVHHVVIYAVVLRRDRTSSVSTRIKVSATL